MTKKASRTIYRTDTIKRLLDTVESTRSSGPFPGRRITREEVAFSSWGKVGMIGSGVRPSMDHRFILLFATILASSLFDFHYSRS